MQNIEVSNILQNYCYICSQHVTERTQHCLICDQCVDGFDHHCVYLGCCVGDSNKRSFYGFLTMVAMQSLYQWILAIIQISYASIIYKSNNILNVNLQSQKNLWVLAPAIVNILINLFPIYFSLYISCYHCGLYKNRMTTYEYIQNVNDKYDQKKLTRREAYALKKCPCATIKCAICLTKLSYRDKEDESSNSSDQNYLEYNANGEQQEDQAQPDNCNMEQTVTVQMESIEQTKSRQGNYNARPYRVVSSAFGLLFALQAERSDKYATITGQSRAKSQMESSTSYKGLVNDKQPIKSLKPFKEVFNPLESYKQLNQLEHNQISINTDSIQMQDTIKLKRIHKKRRKSLE